MTLYAWTFDCYKLVKKDDGTTDKDNYCEVTVVAESFDLAEEDVKNILPTHDLVSCDKVVEMAADGHVITNGRY